VTRIITERQYHHVAPRLAACGFVAEVQGRFFSISVGTYCPKVLLTVESLRNTMGALKQRSRTHEKI